MQRHSAFWLLAMALLFSNRGQGQTTASCPVLSVTAGGAITSSEVAPVFDAPKILDLSFWIGLPGGVAGEHVGHLTLITPRGGVYQIISVPFTGNFVVPGTVRSIAGYPFPVRLEGLKWYSVDSKRMRGIEVRVPVAGTHITDNSLYGRWRASFSIEGVKLPCTPMTTFTILDRVGK